MCYRGLCILCFTVSCGISFINIPEGLKVDTFLYC